MIATKQARLLISASGELDANPRCHLGGRSEATINSDETTSENRWSQPQAVVVAGGLASASAKIQLRQQKFLAAAAKSASSPSSQQQRNNRRHPNCEPIAAKFAASAARLSIYGQQAGSQKGLDGAQCELVKGGPHRETQAVMQQASTTSARPSLSSQATTASVPAPASPSSASAATISSASPSLSRSEVLMSQSETFGPGISKDHNLLRHQQHKQITTQQTPIQADKSFDCSSQNQHHYHEQFIQLHQRDKYVHSRNNQYQLQYPSRDPYLYRTNQPIHQQQLVTMSHYKFHNDCQSSVLTYEQVKRLDFVMDQVVPIHGRGNFPTLYVKLKELVRLIKHKLQNEHSIEIRDVRLNGGAASYVLAPENSHYNDLDLVFATDLSDQDRFDVIRDVVLECLREFYPVEQNYQSHLNYDHKDYQEDFHKQQSKGEQSELNQDIIEISGHRHKQHQLNDNGSRMSVVHDNSSHQHNETSLNSYDSKLKSNEIKQKNISTSSYHNLSQASSDEKRNKKDINQGEKSNFVDNNVDYCENQKQEIDGEKNEQSDSDRRNEKNIDDLKIMQQERQFERNDQTSRMMQNIQCQPQHQMPLNNCAIKEAYVHKMVKVTDDDRWSLISIGVQQSEANCCAPINCGAIGMPILNHQHHHNQYNQHYNNHQHQNHHHQQQLYPGTHNISNTESSEGYQSQGSNLASYEFDASNNLVDNTTCQHGSYYLNHKQHPHNHYQHKQFPNSIDLKFVDRMRRKFEFSVDSFQIILDSLIQFYDYAPQSTITSQASLIKTHPSSTMIITRPLIINRRRYSVCCCSRSESVNLLDYNSKNMNDDYSESTLSSKMNSKKENNNKSKKNMTMNELIKPKTTTTTSSSSSSSSSTTTTLNSKASTTKNNNSATKGIEEKQQSLNSRNNYYQISIEPANSPSTSSEASSSGCSSSSSVVSSSSSSLSCDDDHEDLYCDADGPSSSSSTSSSSASTSSLLSSTNSSLTSTASLCGDVDVNERILSHRRSSDQAKTGAINKTLKHNSHQGKNLGNISNGTINFNNDNNNKKNPLMVTTAPIGNSTDKSDVCRDCFEQQQIEAYNVYDFETNRTSCAVISENFYPTVIGRSEYGNFKEALYHLEKKLIATRSPEEIRGGGLLKYCNLLVKSYKPTNVYQIRTLERYMCSRFFIDFSDLNQQQAKLESYLANHFSDDPILKFDYLTILHNVVQRSTVCLMNHELRLTLNMIRELAYKLNEQQQQQQQQSTGTQQQQQNHQQLQPLIQNQSGNVLLQSPPSHQHVHHQHHQPGQTQLTHNCYHQQKPILIQSGVYRVKLVNYTLAKPVGSS